MEVTIEVVDVHTEGFLYETRKMLFGGAKTRAVKGPITQYAVNLTLVPTEEERAVIKKYQLTKIIVGQAPSFTCEELAAKKYELYRQYKSISEHLWKPDVEKMRSSQRPVTFEEYFDNPHRVAFQSRAEAHAYADYLEKQVLPVISGQLQYYRNEALRYDKRSLRM